MLTNPPFTYLDVYQITQQTTSKDIIMEITALLNKLYVKILTSNNLRWCMQILKPLKFICLRHQPGLSP